MIMNSQSTKVVCQYPYAWLVMVGDTPHDCFLLHVATPYSSTATQRTEVLVIAPFLVLFIPDLQPLSTTTMRH